MTNTTTSEATEHLAYLAHLTVLVDEFRRVRERMTEEAGRQITFAEVADTVAGTNREARLQDYLKEVGEILDKNSPDAVDEDLHSRFVDAATVLEQAEPVGLPKLLS
jgi:hypothetical protein